MLKEEGKDQMALTKYLALIKESQRVFGRESVQVAYARLGTGEVRRDAERTVHPVQA